MTPTQVMQRRLLGSKPQYARDFVVHMANAVKKEADEGRVPSDLLGAIAFWAIYNQMCCTTEESTLLFMQRWDEILETYRYHTAIMEFIEETENGFFEGLGDGENENGTQRR